MLSENLVEDVHIKVLLLNWIWKELYDTICLRFFFWMIASHSGCQSQCCVLCIILQLLGPKKPPDLSEPVREYLVIFSKPLPWIFCVACVYGKKCQALHKGRNIRDKHYDDEIFEPCPILILALAYLIIGLMANSNRWQKFTNCFLKAWSWLWLKGYMHAWVVFTSWGVLSTGSSMKSIFWNFAWNTEQKA